MKEVIRHLHEGHAPSEVKAGLTALVGECDASEMASMEQELMAGGVPAAQTMNMCELHATAVERNFDDFRSGRTDVAEF